MKYRAWPFVVTTVIDGKPKRIAEYTLFPFRGLYTEVYYILRELNIRAKSLKVIRHFNYYELRIWEYPYNYYIGNSNL